MRSAGTGMTVKAIAWPFFSWLAWLGTNLVRCLVFRQDCNAMTKSILHLATCLKLRFNKNVSWLQKCRSKILPHAPDQLELLCMPDYWLFLLCSSKLLYMFCHLVCVGTKERCPYWRLTRGPKDGWRSTDCGHAVKIGFLNDKVSV